MEQGKLERRSARRPPSPQGIAEELMSHTFCRARNRQICLQFPDELLHDSVPVFQAIRSKLPAETELYVLADTTYGRSAQSTLDLAGTICVHLLPKPREGRELGPPSWR